MILDTHNEEMPHVDITPRSPGGKRRAQAWSRCQRCLDLFSFGRRASLHLSGPRDAPSLLLGWSRCRLRC